MSQKNNRDRGTLRSLGERGLLHWILPRLQKRGSYLVSPGDDAAVLSSLGKPVLSIDGLSDGTHFKLGWEPRLKRFGLSLGRALGWKLLGSSLSDLAAMGEVENRWALIFVSAPSSVKSIFLKDFFLGLQETARRHQCLLVGGDTVRGSSLTLAAAVGGTLASRRPMTRSGARPGDLIGVAGTVGDAARGLDVLRGRLKLPVSVSRYFVRRFFNASPMFKEAQVLARTPGVTSLMDLSDALTESLDLLLPSNDLGFEVDMNAIPRSRSFKRTFSQQPQFISPGEDYSLLFTVSAKAGHLFRRSPFKLVGQVRKRSAGRQYFLNGKAFHPPSSFEHFR